MLYQTKIEVAWIVFIGLWKFLTGPPTFDQLWIENWQVQECLLTTFTSCYTGSEGNFNAYFSQISCMCLGIILNIRDMRTCHRTLTTGWMSIMIKLLKWVGAWFWTYVLVYKLMPKSYLPKFMMTSSNGRTFSVTGLLWMEFICYQWIPLTNGSEI